MLQVNEIFYSLQGESTRAGLPCLFIRLTGCNLRCAWCDTRYAYEAGEALSIEEIVERIKPYPCRLVEITGGEPLLQKETPWLAQALLDQGYTVLLETNGTLPLHELPESVIRVVDVKGPSSGETDAFLLENLTALRPTDEVKFVIADHQDFEWACEKVTNWRLLERCPILFSPVASRLDPALLAEWILESGLSVRLQLQLHRILWPSEGKGR